MRLDVYPTDAEAFEAVAARAGELLAAVSGPVHVALSGGRSGRGVLVALAARGDLPWDRIEWYWADERCVPADDPRSNVRLARESLFVPRGVPAARIHPPPCELGDPERIAAAYTVPAFDLVLLGVDPQGGVASLMRAGAALHAAGPIAAVPLEEVVGEPRVARVTITPAALRAARHVLVTVTGDAKAAVLARVLREPADPERLPAQGVQPGGAVEWIVDRAAAAGLLRDARPAPDPQ
jgi:6-phosphogluconolactonase